MRLNFLRWLQQFPYTGPGHAGARQKPKGWASKRLRKQRITKASRKRNRASYGKPKAKHDHRVAAC